MNEVTKQALLSAVRSLLIAAGSGVSARGWASDELVTAIVGAIMVIGPLVWGVLQKATAERAAKSREAVAINVGITVADGTVGPTPLITAADAPIVISQIAPRLAAGPVEPIEPEVPAAPTEKGPP